MGGYNISKQYYQDCYHYYKYIKQKRVVRFYNDEYNIDIGTLIKYLTEHTDHVIQKKAVINQNKYEIFSFESDEFIDYLQEIMNKKVNIIKYIKGIMVILW